MRNIILPLLVVLIAISLFAQNNGIKDLRFNNLSVRDGIAGMSITSFIHDKEGYTWVTSMNGLSRFNGYGVKVYSLGITDRSFAVNTVYEDRNGGLWVGTGYNGMYYYDRSNDVFHRYKLPLKDSVLLTDSYITAIQDDKRGNLWLTILTHEKNTLLYLDRKTGLTTHFGSDEKRDGFIGTQHINELMEDKSGRIWFGSDNGFYCYDRKQNCFAPFFTTGDSLKRQTVKYLCEDARQPGVFWFYTSLTHTGKPLGLWQWNTVGNLLEKFSHTDDAGSIANDSLFSIKNDEQGRLWVCTAQGLSLYNGKGFYNYFPDKDKKYAGNLLYNWAENERNDFWCGGSYGLYYFNRVNKAFTFYNYNAKDIESVYAWPRNLKSDNNGDVWFTGWGQFSGIKWINRERSRFAWYQDNPGNVSRHFSGGETIDFAEAPDRTVWLAADKGVYHWLPETDSVQHIEPAEYKGKLLYPTAVRVDKTGLVWYGIYVEGKGYQGLDCYDPKTGAVTHYKHDDKDSTSLKNNYVYCLCIDHNNNVWAGTENGTVNRFDRKTQSFIRYPCIAPDTEKRFVRLKSKNDVVEFVYEDNNGNVWAGTGLGGLCRLNRATRQFESYPGIIDNTEIIQCIIQDHQNRLWISTIATGIYCFDPKTNRTRRYSVKDGLLFDGASGITEDKSGNIWLICPKGISILNPATGRVRTLVSGKALPDDVTQYSSGISNGDFLFSGRKGFIVLNPDDYIPDTISPIVYIGTVNFTNPSASVAEQKDSSVARWGKKDIHLSYDNNKVTFSYVGIHYQNATATTYAYRLDNYDKKWIEAGTERAATYTSLYPGTYTFHVKAANGDGVWSKTEDAITIIIATPWWQTWWFYTLVAIAAFGLIYLVYRYQLEQALKVERVRNRIASDLHDEIGSTLSAITLFSQIAHDQSKTTVASPQLLKRINETAQKVTGTMRDIVWSVSTKNDSFDKMITHMHEHAAELLDLKGYELHFTADEKLNSINLSMEKRQNIYLIYKEALNNIIKYAGGKNVWISIQREKAHLLLSLKDDGIGFDSYQENAGNGLQNMKNRAMAVHGSAVIHSIAGGGCEVVIKVPV